MTKEAVKIWTSEIVTKWPYAINVSGQEVVVLERQVVSGIGAWLDDKNFIPDKGLLMDLGSGPTTINLFGTHNAKRAYAADVSPHLLGENPLPENRKFLIDVGTERFPENLHSRFGFVVSSRLARYLNQSEKSHVAEEVRKLLDDNGLYMIIDYISSPCAKVLGESSPFVIQEEHNVLHRANFNTIQSGQICIPYHDSRSDGDDYANLEYVIGYK